MDFATLPPEITSALIHSGPGAGSLIEAAGVWRRLGADVEDAVPGYLSVLSSLAEVWYGPSSMAMLQAVEPYLAWLSATAQQCQQVGLAAQAAAAAFELAHSTVVQPVEVSDNRVRLAQLLVTNWFGSNLAAIAETEAQYEGMWLNNSAAMYRYAAASAHALALPQFSPPPAIAGPAAPIPAGLASVAAVAPAASSTPVAAAAVAPAAASPLSTLLSSLSSASGALVNNSWFLFANTWANQAIAGGLPINLLIYLAQLTSAQALQGTGVIGQGLSEGEAAIGGTLTAANAELADALEALESAPGLTAAVGVGVPVGRLTMPPAAVGMLPASQPPVQLLSTASPFVPGESGLPPMLPPMMPPPRTPPRAASDGRRREGRDYENIEYGSEIPGTVMQRPPSAG